MKQKIKITAVIKNNDKILLLRKRNGDFELPQSKMSAGEQPEQCLSRVILDIFDVPPVSLSIIDVITYFDDAGPKPATMYLYCMMLNFLVMANCKFLITTQNIQRWFFIV